MCSDLFEQCFSSFLESAEYDESASALFSIARMAFTAGWRAAGGQEPAPRQIFQLLPPTALDKTEPKAYNAGKPLTGR